MSDTPPGQFPEEQGADGNFQRQEDAFGFGSLAIPEPGFS